MFLSYVPRETFPNLVPMRRRRIAVARPVAGVFPGNSSTPSPRRWPRSAFSNASGRSNWSRAIHGHRPKRSALPNLGHRLSLRFVFALLIAPCLFSMLSGCAATHVAIAKRNLDVSRA